MFGCEGARQGDAVHGDDREGGRLHVPPAQPDDGGLDRAGRRRRRGSGRRVHGLPLWRARHLPAGGEGAGAGDRARRRAPYSAVDAGAAAPPRSAGAGVGDPPADDGGERAGAVRSRPARLLADRPAHAGAGGGAEGDRPVPLPGRGVRAGPDLGDDRSSQGEDRTGADAQLSGAVELPVRRAGRGAAGGDPGAAGGLDVRSQGFRGVQLPQRRPQAGRQGGAIDARQARRRGAERLQGRDAGRSAGAVVAGGGDHGAGAGAGGARRGGDAAAAGAPLSFLYRSAAGRRQAGRGRVRRSGQAGWVRVCGGLAGGEGGPVGWIAGRSLRGPLEHGAAQDGQRRLAV